MASNNSGNNQGGRSNRGFAAKGGEAVSQDREHMAAIGRKGGEASGGGNRGRNASGSGNEERGGMSAGGSRDSQGQFSSGRSMGSGSREDRS